MNKETDDWDVLLAAGIAGDSAAYRRFLYLVTPVIRGIVRSRGTALGEAVCEDIVQEVLLAVHLKRHTWKQDSPVRPWVYAIARYKVVDGFRSRGQRVHVPIESVAESLPAAEAADPTVAWDMEKMIGKLDGRSADIVRRIGLNGESIAETGEALLMSEGAVRVALHRALKRLAALRERFVE
ncbi:sigma-70 family RNA polymerase sigma factor [Thioclava sp. FR2]|uniref:sigma-70 family RNA polymerase sigma factor n=1 Tax=Thioclava sp. FR2 TaxID=3445780 RepID=UPI003EBBD193